MFSKAQGETLVSPDVLLERIRNGDKQAEEALVSQYWRGLHYIVNRQTSDAELAADIAQDAFVVVITKARKGEIENAAAIASFIRNVAGNLLIANYRKEARRKTDSNDQVDHLFEHLQPEHAEKLCQEKLVAVVAQVLDELPTKRDRDLLYRFFVYGQAKTVICEELQLTDAHFDRVLYRARNRLKQILQMRFGIDSSKFSLGLFLSIVLSFTVFDVTSPTVFFHQQVRDIRSTQHLVSMSEIQRPKTKWANTQWKQSTSSSSVDG